MRKNNVAAKGAFYEHRRRQRIFYCLLLIIPVVQFCIFYLGVNINSIILMFRRYDVREGYTFAGFENFINVWRDLTDPAAENYQIMMYSLRNSVVLGLITIFVGTVLSVIFSYYIFKKYRLSELFKVFLFLPNIISSVVLVIIFKKFTDAALPEALKRIFGIEMQGLLSNADTQLPTLMFYTIWAGFGVQIMMYSGAMSSVSPAMIEACELDGCSPFREFLYIMVPSIYPTITTFMVVNVATVFVNQMNLFSFYGPEASLINPEITTIGYYLYKEAYGGGLADLPEIATLGFYMTIISIPITYLVKYLMERFGPSEEVREAKR